jgi:DNA-binding MarR family transcriptional regulator/GNAT superfamily N-acetyltransferase
MHEDIAAVRRFNRFYTRTIGVLEEGHLDSPFSLTEARVFYELAQRTTTTASELARELDLDGGYLSRLLNGLVRRQLVTRSRSPTDARQSLLQLSAEGRAVWQDLDTRASERIQLLLAPLSADRRAVVTNAVQTIQSALSVDPQSRVPYILRPHRAGDMGWIVHRQAVLYAHEYGWNWEYEALIARIVANFLEKLEPVREHCWVAERNGAIVGSVFVVRHPEREGVARLRLLYVEPGARGLGIGGRLVRECTEFANRCGYHTLTLWTNSVLVSARRIYEAEGYRLVKEDAHRMFGKDLVGQTWEKDLSA